ncbi:MAG: fumarylacetoacetate hydrolase family protein [Promicromonosporaceae bacterium]|nr:fumarylacetoacetate hydrolase family protein [Promicromonosporaceae bacterium]
MKIARFTTGSEPTYGIVETVDGRTYLDAVAGDPLFMKSLPTGQRVLLDDDDAEAPPVRLLAPVIPRSKVIGVGLNYLNHIKEMGHDIPPAPVLFMKPNTSVIGPDDPIVLPTWSEEVSYEVELGVVVGKPARNVRVEQAHRYLAGYTVGNDVTARDAQRADGQWTRAKGFDTACPLGPWIVTDFDPSNARITSRVNGVVKQDSNLSDMLFDVPHLVSYISEIMTLLPGDVILTGTPAGVGRIEHGDVVECEIAGIGVLRNPVVRR